MDLLTDFKPTVLGGVNKEFFQHFRVWPRVLLWIQPTQIGKVETYIDGQEKGRKAGAVKSSHATHLIAVHRDQFSRQTQEISSPMKPIAGIASADTLQISPVFSPYVFTFVTVSHLDPSSSLPASSISSLNQNSSHLRPL